MNFKNKNKNCFQVEVVYLFGQLPYKKMKQIGVSGLTAKCDCGWEHTFNRREINKEKTYASTIVFNSVYVCPKCNTSYNGIFANSVDRDTWYRNLSPIGVIISITLVCGLILGGYKFISIFKDNNEPTYYDTGDPDDMTNKEMQQFLEWKMKENKKNWENEQFDGK